MKEKVIVTQGKYIASAVRQDQYPEVKCKEIVFMGRSNVGKSSLINSLTRVRNLARVSGQPGKTQTINFYDLGVKIDGIEERQDFYFVDLPGYGYARTGKESRKRWAKFIDEYLLESEDLQFVCQLVDIRHDPQPSDIDMFHWLIEHDLPVLIVATKADKLGKMAQQKNISRIKKVLGIEEIDVLPYSSTKNEGRSELLDVIGNILVQ